MILGFLHIGKSEHGVCRYGRLLADEAKKRSELRVLESEVTLTGDSRNDTLLLTEAVQKLSAAQIVHIQFTEVFLGIDEYIFHNLRTFIAKCRCPVVVTIHDTEPEHKYRGAGNSVIRTLQYIRQSFRQSWFVCNYIKSCIHRDWRL